MEKNLTIGSVWKTVLYFSLPYILSYFLQTLYGMADLFIIGQFNGVESTTAVSVGSQAGIPCDREHICIVYGVVRIFYGCTDSCRKADCKRYSYACRGGAGNECLSYDLFYGGAVYHSV